jgi:hypothetical protein
MPLVRQPSAAARVALVYITLGSLIVVNGAVAGVYFLRHPSENPAVYYWGAGVFGTGFVLLVIGLAVGWIGRAARRAELPPPVVTAPVAQAEPRAAAAPGIPVAAPPVGPGGLPPPG